MRNAGRLKLGYYPLPPAEGENIRKMLSFTSEPTSVLDPCAGTGAALLQVTDGANCVRYGIELDADRAAASAATGIDTIHGSAFDVGCRYEQFSLLYLNPPYDNELGPFANKRMEEVFLDHTYHWLKQGGVLVFVIPENRLYSCTNILGGYFSDVRVFRLADPESVRFKQCVVFAVRKAQRGYMAERNMQRLRDIVRGYVTPDALDGTQTPYAVPPSDPVKMTHKGLPLDTIEDLVVSSAAYKQTAQFFLPKEEINGGQPLTPLHGGHVGLLCTAGLLNGVFGEGEDRHIARWRSNKYIQVIKEEGEEGEHITRRRERFSTDLALVYENGKVLLLGETEDDSKSKGTDTDEQRSSSNGPARIPAGHS